VLVGAAFWALIILGGSGLFDKSSAPERPGSVVHRMVVQMEREGDIDDFRSVEPDEGWDVEYEVDDGAGFIRIRGEGTVTQTLEYEAILDDDLEAAMERVIEQYGFTIGD
jgi:hypothetical protein